MSDSSQATASAPAGWIPFSNLDGFIGVNGPLYVRREGENVVMGLRIEARHCNPNKVCHGGMLMTFADMMLPIGARFAGKLPPYFLPTINLAMDYLAPAPLGTWIEGRTRLLRVTRNLVFADGTITDGETVVARANGTFKIGKTMSGLTSFDELLAQS